MTGPALLALEVFEFINPGFNYRPVFYRQFECIHLAFAQDSVFVYVIIGACVCEQKQSVNVIQRIS